MTDADSMLLRMRGISKRFPGVLALDDVSLELRRGEVLAVMGENGAGKSTLMKVLGGVLTPDSGEIRLAGESVAIPNVAAARALGIALIHQELMLAPNLDIAGNIFLGAEPRRRALPGAIDRRSMRRQALGLLGRVGLDISPDTPVARLTTGQMQMVEIAKALALEARVIIMDEPTSSLTLAESERLFAIIGELRRGDISVLYISHRVGEVLRISDRITVMRDGKRAGDLDAKTTDHDEIVSKMIGRELSAWFPQRSKRSGAALLQVDRLIVPGASEGVSFDARSGEILGFAGLVGSGRTELMRVLFGVDAPLGGTIRFSSEPFSPARPADAISRGIHLVPEDRKRHGLVMPMSVTANLSLPDIANYRPRGWLQRGHEQTVAATMIGRLAIRTPSPKQRTVNLSGGNQQKVVLGKWLAMRPKLLILDEPTRGIDVGAKAEIYRQIVELADAGITILMVSSDMEEVLGMSDRVIVWRQRRIAGVLGRDRLNEENLVALMTGKELSA